MDDKAEEFRRYEEVARQALESAGPMVPQKLGASAVAPELRTPYIYYEQRIHELVSPAHRVLELGAGSGLHTAALVRTGAHVTASDISPSALELLRRRLAALAPERLITRVADMEALPFESGSFDVVACAGSLSYGEPGLVDAEVRRVLRDGGTFVCVDSLNHNPVYRLNRWLHYTRGERTMSTLLRMPDARRIEAIGQHFQSVEVRYFGALTWTMPLLRRVVGSTRATRISVAVDQLVNVKRSAFKFVLVAQGRR
ncbi:MAG TPA: class I SAM-dependent methyltransferase [Gemmatimonadaceae bacterium]|nr:class I SAM-dependent methyltransferase [Gemmatimonadaceae bacterium]